MRLPWLDRLAFDIKVARRQFGARRDEIVLQLRVRRWALPFWLAARVDVEVTPHWLNPFGPLVVFGFAAWVFWARREAMPR